VRSWPSEVPTGSANGTFNPILHGHADHRVVDELARRHSHTAADHPKTTRDRSLAQLTSPWLLSESRRRRRSSSSPCLRFGRRRCPDQMARFSFTSEMPNSMKTGTASSTVTVAEK
jgi:hypothetical protein